MSLTPAGTWAPNPTTVRARSVKLSAQGDRIVYAHGRTVVIRDMKDPRATVVYAQHAQPVTVARLSPSGYYVASADITGKVRVWDVAGTEQMLKLEVPALGGRVHDLQWDGESKRILVAGEGREKYTHTFLVDTGSSVGELNGHSKPVNAVAVRAQRPFRAATGADDAHVLFYTGVPFKYARTLSHHTRFVHDVAYAPDGATFVSAGADGRLCVYDGVSGDLHGTIEAHQGTIFAVSFAPDSKHLASAGADGAVRVWDVAARTLVCEWRSDAQDRVLAQQVGLVWTAGAIVSLSFHGMLTVLDPSALRVRDTLVGPTMGLVDVAVSGGKIAAACVDGRVYLYDECVDRCPREAAWPSPVRMGSTSSAWVVASLDNALRVIRHDGSVTKHDVSGHIRSLQVCDRASFVLTDTGMDVVSHDGECVSHRATWPDDATCLASQASLVAIGAQDAKVYLFRYDGALHPLGELSHGRSAITAMAFSPDASLLAVGESSGKILVYDVEAQTLKLSQWVFHTARIDSIQWSPDGAHALSASLDTNIYVWSVERPMQKAVLKNAHAGGVKAAVWLDAHTIVSAGADGVVRWVRRVCSP